MTFDPLVRIQLANQFRILQILDQDQASEYEMKAEILEGGFEAEYGRVIGTFNENGLSEEECGLVNDALLMHSFILDHAATTNADLRAFTYVEFDANSEWDHLKYGQFLFARNPHGYPGVKGVIDSHGPRIDSYRARTTKWKDIQRQRNLTEADVVRILLGRLENA